VLWLLLTLVSLSALAWLWQLLSRNSRVSVRFVYDAASAPELLHGIMPGDLTPAAPVGDPQEWPTVTIIVPGRNEGHMLPDTLGSMCRMEYPNYRIVFIDDQSTDNTRQVCDQLQTQYKHLQVIHNTTPPPDGWVGKVWAIHQARQEATTPYILFTDSDLKYHPQCLKQMMRLALQRKTDLLSLLPAMETHTIGERLGLLAGMKLISAFFPLNKSNDPNSPMALTAGGFLFFRREAYEAIGGHEAARKQVVEDIALGSMTKAKGFSIYTVATNDLMTARMYEGWRDTYHGLKKNAYAGSNYNPFLYVAGSSMILITAVLVPIYPIAALLAWHLSPGTLTATIFATSIVAALAMLMDMRRCVRFLRFPLYCVLLSPLSALFFLTILTHSMFDHYFGGNKWAGRRYKPEHVDALAKTGQ
jgi:chlorobactene glucosyltransferase